MRGDLSQTTRECIRDLERKAATFARLHLRLPEVDVDAERTERLAHPLRETRIERAVRPGRDQRIVPSAGDLSVTEIERSEKVLAEDSSLNEVREKLTQHGLKLRNDPCGGFEVYVAGFKTAAEAQTFKDNAKSRGFDVAIETN